VSLTVSRRLEYHALPSQAPSLLTLYHSLHQLASILHGVHAASVNSDLLSDGHTSMVNLLNLSASPTSTWPNWTPFPAVCVCVYRSAASTHQELGIH
jgi:hypothetical protein